MNRARKHPGDAVGLLPLMPPDRLNVDANRFPDIADLAAQLHFSPAEGRIWLNDQRMLLIHSQALGVLRRELIETGAAREAPLRLDDLRRAGRWFVGNSLRGLQIAGIAGSALAPDAPNQK